MAKSLVSTLCVFAYAFAAVQVAGGMATLTVVSGVIVLDTREETPEGQKLRHLAPV
jgi:hypothetical protein